MCKAPTCTTKWGKPKPRLLDHYAIFSSAYGNKRLTPNIRPSERTVLTPKAKERQVERYALRDDLRKFTTKERIHGCGLYKVEGNGVVKLKGHHETGSSFFTGVQRCGYAQFCPVCGAKIAHGRAAEIAEGVEFALRNGYGVMHLTLTVSHGRHNTLSEMRDLLPRAWAFVTSGRGWTRLKKEYGLCGFIRAWDDTWGEENGWHPHFHNLLFTEKPLTARQLDELHSLIFARWESFVASQGYEKPAPEWTRLDRITSQKGIGRYLNKLSLNIGNELTRTDLKKAKEGSRLNHWQILKGVALTGEADLYDLWMEWEEVMGGVQLVRWSNGLKARFGITERTDKEIAEAEESYTWERVLNDWEWDLLTKHAHHIPLLHSCIRTHGPEAVDPFFDWLAMTVHAPPERV